MGINLFRFFNAFICSVLVLGASANAMKKGPEADPQESIPPSTIIVKPSCDPLPSENQAVRSVLRTPVASLMNLDPLYRLRLSGRSQIGAVIESAPLQIAPGMSGVIVNSIESYDKDDHASMVAQVVGSQIPGIGLAPGAKVFFGSSHAKLNGEISHSYEDAVKLAIRAGAKAINLSFKQFLPDYFSKKEEKKDKAKKAHYDFTSAIAYALKQGIPVFTSGGNNIEDLETTKVLKEIIKSSNIYHDELLVIAGGFEYPEDVFGREDIIFSMNSARVTSKDFHLRRLMLTAPYKVKVYEYESIEDRRKKLLEFRKRVDAEDFRQMWIDDLSKHLDPQNLKDVRGEDIELIKRNLEHFHTLFKADKVAFTSEHCQFFLDQAKRTHLPSSLSKAFEKFGYNFLSLSIDLLTSDPTQPSSIPIEERRRLEERNRTLSPNYDPTKANGEFEKAIMAFGEDQRPLEHAFSLQTVRGTSFSSPALMSVYLLLNEYVERQGNLLKAEDIIRCMRASAWQKPYPEEGEDLTWYGSGVIDGGKALEYCQLLIDARKLSQQQRYDESLSTWKNFLSVLKGHAKGKYILEVTQAYKASSAYHDIPHAGKGKVLEEFYRDILSFWPEVYEGHHQDRFNAFMLFEKGEYKDARHLLKQMYGKTKHILQRTSLVEWVLFSLFNKKDRPLYCSFMPAKKKFDSWLNSLIESEFKRFIPYQTPKGVIFADDYSREGRLPASLGNIRYGYNTVSSFLNEIEKTWAGFEELNLEDTYHNLDGFLFLSAILDLPWKLKPFVLPEDLHRRLEGHMERAKKEKETLDKIKQQKSQLTIEDDGLGT